VNRHFTLKPALYVVGLLIVVLGLSMLIPGFVDMAAGDTDWRGFFIAGAGTVTVGLLFIFTNREERITLSRRQAFVLTVLSWLAIATYSADPIFISRFNISYTDAIFEEITGLTTTRSTVLTGLDTAPPAIFLWRTLLQR
jgi:trk system potassium uptake protein TrkH